MKTCRITILGLAATILLALLAFSGLRAYDQTTWALETFPVVLVLIVTAKSYRRFPLTDLLYACIFVHALILIVGGIYSYAKVPLGFQIADWLHLARNPYDKVGHFFQGFVPALAAREILIRGHFVNGRRMQSFLVLCIALAVSASYELLEWGVAEILGQGAEAFLGTQGDEWDTQSDMLMALIGASAALAFLSRTHDRQIARLSPSTALSPDSSTLADQSPA